MSTIAPILPDVLLRPAEFVGKNAARAALGRPVGYGPQPERIGGASVWVLPSTSGAARRFWDIEPWRDLAVAVAG